MHRPHEVELAVEPDFAVHDYSCLDDSTGWFGEYQVDHQVVLVRNGMFRVRRDGIVDDIDNTLCYLGVPGTVRSYSHLACGERCTIVTLSPSLWRSMAGETPVTGYRAYTSGRIDLAHRRMLAARPDPGYALTEQLLELLAGLLSQTGRAPAEDAPGRSRRLLVDRAREAIAADDPSASRLSSLARMLGVSPFRLSRAFPRELGVSLPQYRNRIRVGRALDRLSDGEPSLANLAVDLGFSDQAHLTRVMREHLGHTPAAVRRMLIR